MLLHKIEYILIILVSGIAGIIGKKRIKRFANLLSWVIFYFIPIRKKTTIGNLKKAFPEKPQNEILKIAQSNYSSIILIMLEILLVSKMSKDELMTAVTCSDIGNIERLYNRGNGLILLTAHFGNWELGAIYLGSKTPVRLSVLVKPQSNKILDSWLNGIRRRFGNEIIFLGPSVRNIYKALKDKKIVGMVGDQRGHKDSRRINFFNVPTAMFTGTAEIALKLDVPILIVLGERIDSFNYKLHLKEIPIAEFGGSFDERVDQINQYYVNFLEDKVRMNPNQWFWMHKIWKY